MQEIEILYKIKIIRSLTMRNLVLLWIVIGTAQWQAQTMVYICTGPKAIVFHRSNQCKGLLECRNKIILVLRSEAKTAYRRRHCYLCYRLMPLKH
jgi:hypothetical protein